MDTQKSQALLARLKSLSKELLGQVLSVVARLNSEPSRILDGNSLSPGELRKVMLSIGIQDAPQLIIMDEPTNHLDLGSVEALESLLKDCPCALLLVSHDQRFLDATTTIHWNFNTQKNGDTEIVIHW
jgi:ATPase subunit of ABC transporter with duplicated ATPase domains